MVTCFLSVQSDNALTFWLAVGDTLCFREIDQGGCAASWAERRTRLTLESLQSPLNSPCGSNCGDWPRSLDFKHCCLWAGLHTGKSGHWRQLWIPATEGDFACFFSKAIQKCCSGAFGCLLQHSFYDFTFALITAMQAIGSSEVWGW